MTLSGKHLANNVCSGLPTLKLKTASPKPKTATALPAQHYCTFSVRFTCDAAPLGGVAVTTSGYDPGGVALPLGDFARLLHADIPAPKIMSIPNESAHRGCLLNVHGAPHDNNATSNIPKPVPNPPGVGPSFGPPLGPPFGISPLQNVFTTMATLVVVPFNVTVARHNSASDTRDRTRAG